MSNNKIILDNVTKRFTQITPEGKVCYACSSGKYVDDHHIDCREGTINPETVPLCRRCHRTYHSNGVSWFEDEYLDRIIEIENKRRKFYGIFPIKREDVKRSKYWIKMHKVEKAVTLDPISKKFTQRRLL